MSRATPSEIKEAVDLIWESYEREPECWARPGEEPEPIDWENAESVDRAKQRILYAISEEDDVFEKRLRR